MSDYLVSARKYRPATFDNVVGQSSLTTTLKNSISSGRLAHAYLFCGPRGVGKTTCARIFAKTINCLSPKPNGDACEECESCKAFNEMRSYNIHELDAASNNGVDDIRQLIEQVNIPPQIGKYKVFIVDEVHMLSAAAFNAFLKTLEEPPAHVIFILATTEKHKLLPTILSRCQIYDFQRMTIQDIVSHLEHVAQEERITYELTALNEIAQKADGGMRDALSIFDQVASFCQGNITYQQTIADLNVLDYKYYFQFVEYFLTNKIPDIILTFNEILGKGFDGCHFINGLNNHLRNLLISRDASTVKLLETSDDIRQQYIEQAKRCQPRFLYSSIRRCTDCDLNYRQSQNKRLLVELTLIEIAQSTQGDTDGQPSGLCPTKILKPIFATLVKQAPAQSPAQTEQVQNNSNSVKPTAINPQSIHHLEPSFNKQSDNNGSLLKSKTNSFSILSDNGNPGIQSITTPTETSSVPNNTPKEETDTTPLLNNGGPVTLEATNLVIAWRTFASRLPQEETALASRMNNINPKLATDGKTIEVAVDNAKVQKLIQENSERILNQMRVTFDCPDIRLIIKVEESHDQHLYLSRTQRFQMMCDENPALIKMKELFQLALR